MAMDDSYPPVSGRGEMADQRYTTSASTGPIDISEKPIARATIVSEDISSDSSSPTPVKHGGILGRLCHYEAILDRRFGVEAQGPERILPQDRKPEYEKWSNQAVMALLWASGTMNLSCFTTGFLGWEFGLSLKQTILVTVFATLIGSATTGWCATLGPGTGLRQVSISRYSFGWWPSKIIALLNVIEQLGWSSVGCITGGLSLSAVSDGRVNLVLGVVIIAVVGLCFSFVGLRAVMTYEKYAWAVFFLIFMIMYGEVGHYADIKTPPQVTGATESGMILTLLGVVYGSSASWSSICSDYYVQYPVNTSKTKIFLLTTFGITIPTCIGMVMGCCVGSTMGINTEWADTYNNSGVGQLIQTILYPLGFAKFLLVILVLSGSTSIFLSLLSSNLGFTQVQGQIGMNCIAIYSAALSIQQFARPLKAVPRFFWTLIVFVGILLLGIAGRNHLLEVLENFLALLGYWNTAFFVILFLEHYLFRGGSLENYDLEAWNTPSRMPVGIAGLTAFLLGIVGCILGMVQTWYVGVIAKKIGDSGGDIGNQLALVFTVVAYIPVRYLERKYIGR
ncbi:hypothetical protein MMC08_006035 [Hypocenomyce scalaris]|nr:hypothetical protein [Hypocenomyce scalaris]